MRSMILISVRVMPLVACAWLLAGCGQSLLPGAAGKITVPESVGGFSIVAGEEKQGKAVLPAAQVNRAAQTMSIQAADIVFEPDESRGGTMEVSAAFGEVSGFGEACANPVDAYPSFTITVNANGEVTGITPSSIPVNATTVDLVTSGQFTICVTYSSTVSGSFDINAFTMN